MASGHEVSVRFTGDPRQLIEACKTVEDALSGVQKTQRTQVMESLMLLKKQMG